jgi:hypothetical protein
MGFLQWLSETSLANWVLTDDYGYYELLGVHAVGMGIVTGVVYVLGLRVLGFAKGIGFENFRTLFNVAWIGFIMNFISGAVLFVTNGVRLVKNIPFITKISLIAIGGIALWLLARTLHAELKTLGVGPDGTSAFVDFSTKAKFQAVATMLFWTGVIMAGRLIAYTISYF